MRTFRILLGLALVVAAIPLMVVFVVVRGAWNLADNALEWIG